MPITDIEFLEEALEDAMVRAYGGEDRNGTVLDRERGVAGVQAVKLVLEIKGQLEQARAASLAAMPEDINALAEGAFCERLQELAEGAPDPHLEVWVKEYMRRHKLKLVPAEA